MKSLLCLVLAGSVGCGGDEERGQWCCETATWCATESELEKASGGEECTPCYGGKKADEPFTCTCERDDRACVFRLRWYCSCFTAGGDYVSGDTCSSAPARAIEESAVDNLDCASGTICYRSTRCRGELDTGWNIEL